MRIPEELRSAIAATSARVPIRDVAAAAEQLSLAYRRADFAVPILRTPAHRIAYLQVRLPATYAALAHVFAALARTLPGWQPRSLLDLGAGPGTAAWAASAVFSGLQRIALIDRDGGMAELGRELAAHASHRALVAAQWQLGDIASITTGSFDLVVVSYALGELSAAQRASAVDRAWCSAQVLVLVEPGTPRGFDHVLASRSWLLEAGASIAAPCPHHLACPLTAAGDWCHFSQRVERSTEHRRIKGADLGYEDEKFSYIVASKQPAAPAEARIVRHPLHHGGHTQLVLCTAGGLKRETVTRAQKERYRRARKAAWGDAWK